MEKINHNIVETPEPSFDINEVKARILDEIEKVVIKSQDRNLEGNLLVSPDGSRSNLNEQNWKIVRTESFKKWFGDWQESKDYSVVVDKNGEPKIVTHRAYKEKIVAQPPRKDFSVSSRFIHFTTKWVGSESSSRYGNNIHHAFLNVRKMLNCGAGGMNYYQLRPEAKAGFINNIDDDFLNFLKKANMMDCILAAPTEMIILAH